MKSLASMKLERVVGLLRPSLLLLLLLVDCLIGGAADVEQKSKSKLVKSSSEPSSGGGGSTSTDTVYTFVPLASIVGLLFVGTCSVVILLAKVMYGSFGRYSTKHSHDLIVFRPPTKNEAIPGLWLNYVKSDVNKHNIAAAANSNFSIASLGTKKRKRFRKNPRTSNHIREIDHYKKRRE